LLSTPADNRSLATSISDFASALHFAPGTVNSLATKCDEIGSESLGCGTVYHFMLSNSSSSRVMVVVVLVTRVVVMTTTFVEWRKEL